MNIIHWKSVQTTEIDAKNYANNFLPANQQAK